MRNLFAIVLLSMGIAAFSESLFQVKNNLGKVVLDVTTDGLIILNPKSTIQGYDDTLMVITDTELKAFVNDADDKGLARSFAIVSSGSSTKDTKSSLMRLQPENYFIGHQSGMLTTGTKNTFFGFLAGKENTGGYSNIFIGNEAGLHNGEGHRNIFIGDKAGFSNIGDASSVTVGHDNIYLGSLAGKDNIDGEHNTLIGTYSGYASVGTKNTFLGAWTGLKCDGTSNLFAGSDAGRGYFATPISNTGNKNVFLGGVAGNMHSEGDNNTMVGYASGYSAWDNASSGTQNTFLGSFSGYKTSRSGNNNTFIGYSAGQGNNGNGNVFLGHSAGSQENGSDKLYIANSNTTTPLIKGSFPNGSLEFNTSNLYIYNRSGHADLYLDSYASANSFSNLVFRKNGLAKGYVGYHHGDEYLFLYENGYVSLQNGNLGIGLQGGATQKLDVNGKARIRNIGSGAYAGAVNRTSDGTLISSTSDIRLKENISTLESSLEKVNKLRGVNFTWRSDEKSEKKIGFIAQEMEKVLPELVFTNPTDGYKGVNYAEVTAVLTEAIKELDLKNKKLEEKNTKLENEISEIKKMLKEYGLKK